MKHLMLTTILAGGLAAAPLATAQQADERDLIETEPTRATAEAVDEAYETEDLNRIVLAKMEEDRMDGAATERSTMTSGSDRSGEMGDVDTEAPMTGSEGYQAEGYGSSSAKDHDMKMEAYGGNTIVEAAAGDERFTTLVALIEKAGLAETLGQEGPYTVFAPTDDAFDALSQARVDYLMSDEGRDDLVEVLKAHVATGEMMSTTVPYAGLEVLALNDHKLDVTREGNKVMVDGAEVISADIETSNGVIHAIDKVIVPGA